MVSKRDQIAMDEDEVLAYLQEQTILNVAFNGLSGAAANALAASAPMFWDLRVRSLEAQALEPLKAPDEMRFAELRRYIDALHRSGSDVNKLSVELQLKLAIPVTCLIIALFGAPLAITNPRAGAAVGIAISLGTTVLFLLITQITKAVGAGGVVLGSAATCCGCATASTGG